MENKTNNFNYTPESMTGECIPCVCCGAYMPPETNSMICYNCAHKLKDTTLVLTTPKTTNNRVFLKEFKRVKKAISRAACSGERYVRIYVKAVVVDEILTRLKKDGFMATQSGVYYDSPLFIAW